MEGKTWVILVLVVAPVVSEPWGDSEEEIQDMRNRHRDYSHHHSKRHMEHDPEIEIRAARQMDASKRRVATPRYRKKPSGNLAPLQEEDMDNDEVVSVAIGPPSMKQKFGRINWKPVQKTVMAPPTPALNNYTRVAANLVQNILTQLGREFLARQVSEDFVFGQYIGNAMKNMSSELKLTMQHEMLDLIVRYQKLNHGDTPKQPYTRSTKPEDQLPNAAATAEKKFGGANDTASIWPEISNLAKIVG